MSKEGRSDDATKRREKTATRMRKERLSKDAIGLV